MITIVVGSATGMGAATVRRLHRLEHEIVGVDRAEPEDPDLYSGFFFVDLNDGNRVQEFVADVKREGKPIRAIVYCAAVHYPAVPFEEYPLEKWDQLFNVNVRSAFIILHGLASQIVDGGRIVTIGSGGVHTGSVEVAYRRLQELAGRAHQGPGETPGATENPGQLRHARCRQHKDGRADLRPIAWPRWRRTACSAGGASPTRSRWRSSGSSTPRTPTRPEP